MDINICIYVYIYIYVCIPLYANMPHYFSVCSLSPLGGRPAIPAPRRASLSPGPLLSAKAPRRAATGPSVVSNHANSPEIEKNRLKIVNIIPRIPIRCFRLAIWLHLVDQSRRHSLWLKALHFYDYHVCRKLFTFNNV